MPAGLVIGTAGGNKDLLEMYVGTASGNKLVTEGWVGTAGGNKLFGAPLTATSPTPVTWSAGPAFVAGVQVTAQGGFAPYTYLWAKTGNCSFTSGQTSTFAILQQDGLGPWTATCTVTDSIGQVVVANTVTIQH
jgi:hypothetical protein